MKTPTLLKRYWPALLVLTFLTVVMVLVELLPDIRRQITELGTWLFFLMLALSLPTVLVGKTRLPARIKTLPEAYAAATLAATAVFVEFFDAAWGPSNLDAIGVLALIALGVFRAQVHNERATPQPRTQEAPDDLERRFTDMARQLSESAEAFATLQAEVQARAHMANELARQAEASRHQAESDRKYAAEQQEALDAVERLVQVRVKPIVTAIERGSRRSQVVFLMIGAVAGTALQILVEQLL